MTKASRQKLSKTMTERWATKRNGGGGSMNGTAVLEHEEVSSIISEAQHRAEQVVSIEIPLQDVWTLEDILAKEVGRAASFAQAQEDISAVSRLLGLKLRLLTEGKRVAQRSQLHTSSPNDLSS